MGSDPDILQAARIPSQLGRGWVGPTHPLPKHGVVCEPLAEGKGGWLLPATVVSAQKNVLSDSNPMLFVLL